MSTKSVANKAGGKKPGQARANPTDRQSREWLAVQVRDGIGEVRAELDDAFEALTLASSEGCAESHGAHADLALALVRADLLALARETRKFIIEAIVDVGADDTLNAADHLAKALSNIHALELELEPGETEADEGNAAPKGEVLS